jgi:hypothetical protein
LVNFAPGRRWDFEDIASGMKQLGAFVADQDPDPQRTDWSVHAAGAEAAWPRNERARGTRTDPDAQ